jgi:hypothetical protein
MATFNRARIYYICAAAAVLYARREEPTENEKKKTDSSIMDKISSALVLCQLALLCPALPRCYCVRVCPFVLLMASKSEVLRELVRKHQKKTRCKWERERVLFDVHTKTQQQRYHLLYSPPAVWQYSFLPRCVFFNFILLIFL